MSFTIEIECEETGFSFDPEELAERAAFCCLKEENFPYEAEISLTITDDAGIRELNRTQRGIDRATDVLSFPMLSYEAPGDFSFLSKERDEDFNPDTGEALLGDIVISAERVRAQALDYGHSEEREFAFLIVHSMLHLFGYDHMEEDEARLMEEKQRQIMNILQIMR